MDACKELLGRYQTDGDTFLQRIVTVGESWAHYFQPETKRERERERAKNGDIRIQRNPTNFLQNHRRVK
jgi:hypothetical protein